MNLNMGSQVFRDVSIPLLWGTRAVVQDSKGRLSVIDLSGTESTLEILGERPAPNVDFRPLSDGAFEIMKNGDPLYLFEPATKTLRGLGLNLPDCVIASNEIRIGTNRFQSNTVSGFGVGIAISEGGGIGIGGPLPPGLARLRI